MEGLMRTPYAASMSSRMQAQISRIFILASFDHILKLNHFTELSSILWNRRF